MSSAQTPQRIRQLRRLFEQAAAFPPGERAAALAAAAPDDDGLRRDADALLAVDARAADMLAWLGASPEPAASSAPWDRVRALLAAAATLTADARDPLLDAVADGDDARRAAVVALLAAHDADPAAFAAPDDASPAAAAPAAAPPPSGGSDDLVGGTVGHYEIVGRLGRGGMGIVYRARDENLDRDVAIKLLPPGMHADEAAEARFVHEARAVSAIDHPNIAAVHEIGRTEDGVRFIVMPFYDGETLRAKIGRAPLPLEEAYDLAAQLGRGLQRAHEHGIVHRDIKPENVMVTRRGVVKILDFGLAKRQDVILTATGVSMGTLAYMAPEQTYGGDVDHRADLWAYGIVVFELLTGRHPFAPGGTPIATQSGGSAEDAVRTLRPEVPDALGWALGALLRPALAERASDLHGIVDELERLRTTATAAHTTFVTTALPVPPGGPHAAPTVAPTVAPTTPSGVRGLVRTRAAKLGLGAAAVVVAAAVSVVLLVGGPTEAPAVSPAARAEAQALVEEGSQLLDDNQVVLAQAKFEQALAVDSTYSEAWSSLAAAQWRQGELDAAVAAGAAAVRHDSTNATAFYNIALAHHDAGRAAEARAAYEATIRIDPAFVPAYSALGNLLVEQGDPAAAIDVLERGRAAGPRSGYLFLIYKNLGMAQLARGDAAAAVEVLEASFALQPYYADTLELLRRAYTALGEPDRFEALLRDQLRRETDPGRRQFLEGWLGGA